VVWHLVITDTAEKQLEKLDRSISRKARKFLEELCKMEDPADRGHSLSGPWAGFHAYKIGQLRMVVQIERNIITISLVKVDRRDSVY
jgi:mRNA-degrading endonuclease RelE of RelBE toxin-antitoxin system